MPCDFTTETVITTIGSQPINTSQQKENAIVAKNTTNTTTATTDNTAINEVPTTTLSPTINADQYEIVTFTEDYIPQVAIAFSVIFSQEEPLCMGTLTTPMHYYNFALQYVQKCAQAKCSHLAIEKNSRMVVGFHLSHDYDTWVEPHDNDAGIITQGKLVDRLHEIYHEEEEEEGQKQRPRNEKVLKICSTGVYSFARGLGLAKRMLEANLKLAKQQGFSKVIVECTGVISQSIYKKSGFQEVARVYYKEYEIEVPHVEEGKITGVKKIKPFINIPAPHEFINLAIKDL
ncbi:hypothetical protein ABK040_012985 [Willaertia magna]